MTSFVANSPSSKTTSSVAPSVYIAYQNLLAYVSCPSGATLARGKAYNTTVAYAPEDLSTAMSARAQQTECTYITVNYTMLGDYSSSGNPDFFLSIPSSLTSLDPAWSTCTPALYGAWDPPTTLRPATALTDPADEITPSPPATPAGRSTPVYAPATTTAAADGPTDATPSMASVPGASHVSNVPKTNAAEPDPSNPLVVHSSEGLFVQAPSGGADMAATSYTTGSVAHISGHDPPIEPSAVIMSGSTHILLPPSAPTSTLPLINGEPMARAPDGGLVFAGSTVAPGSQATISGHTVSVGLSDAVIDGSRYALPTQTAEKEQLFPVTLANGIVASPNGIPNEVKIGDELVSINEPAITISGAAVSLGPSVSYISSLVLPLTAATNSSSIGLGDLIISALENGQSLARNGSNDSNAVVFTGGTLRSPQFHSIRVLALIATIVATVNLAS